MRAAGPSQLRSLGGLALENLLAVLRHLAGVDTIDGPWDGPFYEPLMYALLGVILMPVGEVAAPAPPEPAPVESAPEDGCPSK